MKKKYLIICTLLFLLVALSACRTPRKEDLFKQKSEGENLVQSEEETTTDKDADDNRQEASEASLYNENEATEADPAEDRIQKDNTAQVTKGTQKDKTAQAADGRQTMSTDQPSDEIQTVNTDHTAQKDLTTDQNQITGKDQDQTTGQNYRTDSDQTDQQETLGENIMNSFYYEELSDEIKERINGKSYGKNCDIPYEELRYVKVLHYGFDGEVHEGEMIVNKAIAQDAVDIFQELYDEKYPIERMVLVDDYDADDNMSMAANNSSAFNYRVVEGTNRISLHSYGMAIDINPLYNPYVHAVDGETVVTPVNGAEYEDRSLDCEYYIDTEDACYKAFTSRGFTWGGDWKSLKDYQHFQKALE